jgi:hypothetical protein
MVNQKAIELLARGLYRDAFAVLGPHVEGTGAAARVVIRALQPAATAVTVVPDPAAPAGPGEARVFPMTRIHQAGVFEVAVPGAVPFGYRLRIEWASGETQET